MGKQDLLGKLPGRLAGYSRFLTEVERLVVLVDCDDDDCARLKQRIERAGLQAGMVTRSTATTPDWRLASRIAIEVLEAWYFGDWESVREAYPRVPATIPQQEGFRDPDAIRGGTWEALERTLKAKRYFPNGLRIIEAARDIGSRYDPFRSVSQSFIVFRDARLEALD
jgi:hypothetical protein